MSKVEAMGRLSNISLGVLCSCLFCLVVAI